MLQFVLFRPFFFSLDTFFRSHPSVCDNDEQFPTVFNLIELTHTLCSVHVYATEKQIEVKRHTPMKNCRKISLLTVSNERIKFE